jgi:hypothetical protein
MKPSGSVMKRGGTTTTGSTSWNAPWHGYLPNDWSGGQMDSRECGNITLIRKSLEFISDFTYFPLISYFMGKSFLF